MKSKTTYYSLWFLLFFSVIVLAIQESNRTSTFDDQEYIIAALRAASDNTIIADKEGKILYISDSAADIFQYLPSELKGKNIKTLIPERYQPRHEQAKSKAIKRTDEKVSTVYCNGLRKDNSEISLEIRVKVKRDPSFGKILVVRILPSSMLNE